MTTRERLSELESELARLRSQKFELAAALSKLSRYLVLDLPIPTIPDPVKPEPPTGATSERRSVPPLAAALTELAAPFTRRGDT